VRLAREHWTEIVGDEPLPDAPDESGRSADSQIVRRVMDVIVTPAPARALDS